MDATVTHFTKAYRALCCLVLNPEKCEFGVCSWDLSSRAVTQARNEAVKELPLITVSDSVRPEAERHQEVNSHCEQCVVIGSHMLLGQVKTLEASLGIQLLTMVCLPWDKQWSSESCMVPVGGWEGC
ncbi:hypothetical protein I79_006312 [Cricetulus griseus]|uniref:Uncharacterized protein n=1 Tax=Cricetulus griseus TaxID=10029 RepID=G3H7I0_CRIGR|nr:hypothetical protein I79_006312 [Cricetulus griseus]